MFKIGRVVGTRGQHHHRGLGHIAGRQRAQGIQQHIGVVFHRTHLGLPQHLGKGAGHHPAVSQHIRNPTGNLQVVLEDTVNTLTVAYQIDTGDMGIHLMG